jgi:hypothetical protein
MPLAAVPVDSGLVEAMLPAGARSDVRGLECPVVLAQELVAPPMSG